uniref:Glycine N-methyltransferase n=1 Tax=Falco tinnunculus TaxID=100819 RepID=A0A8C4UP11_FALTI
MVDSVYRTRSLGVAAEGLPDQYADGRAARVWQLYIGDTRGRTAEYRSWLLALLRQHRCRSVLDVACGTGVDSIMLLEEGFQVTSVDASDKMLKYALKERWERRKEEPFDRWGAGAAGAGRGVQTPTSHPGAGRGPCPSPSRGLRQVPGVCPRPHAVLGPLAGCCRLGGLAAGTGRDLPLPAAWQAQATALARPLAPGRLQHPQGPREGWATLGWGAGAWGGLLSRRGAPALTLAPVLQSSRRPTGSHWRRTWRSRGMGLTRSFAWATPSHTCLTSKVSCGGGCGYVRTRRDTASSSRLRTCPNSCHK